MGTATQLKQVQIGQETIFGTSVAASARLAGVTDVKFMPDQTVVHPNTLGHVGPSDLVSQTYLGVKGTITSEVSAVGLRYLLHSLFGAATITGTNPYTYTYVAPWATSQTQKFLTLEVGPDGSNAAYIVTSAVCTKISISWKAADTWKVTSDWLAVSMTPGTLTSLSKLSFAAPGPPAFTSDAVAGTMGSTAISGTLYGFQLDIDTGRHLKQFNLQTPEAVGDNIWTAKLKLDMEWNANSKAFVTGALAATPYQRQFSLTGTNSAQSVAIQFAGVLMDVPNLWEDRDGNMVVSAGFEAIYNTTFAGYLTLIAICATATLT